MNLSTGSQADPESSGTPDQSPSRKSPHPWQDSYCKRTENESETGQVLVSVRGNGALSHSGGENKIVLPHGKQDVDSPLPSKCETLHD